MIGTLLIGSLHDLIGGEGQFAILSSTPTATNQQQALALAQAFPALKDIFVPAGIGLPAAARALEVAGLIDRVKVTGLAPATLMTTCIEAGQAQDIWWNVTNLGYLTYYAAQAVAMCQVTGAEGETFSAAIGAAGIAETQIGGEHCGAEFPRILAELAGFDAVIRSDIGAVTLLITPDARRGKSGSNRLELLKAYVLQQVAG